MNYGYLLWYRLSALFGRRRPILGGVKLTHDCNLACIHCPFKKRKGASLSYEGALSALDTLYSWGVRIVIFEGGEPFLWRDGDYRLNDLVTRARRRFFSVGVTTNGTFPLVCDADVLWVSIDGLQPTHDRIRGECFQTVMRNIEASDHPRLYAHVTINALNWREIPKLVEFLGPKVKGITIQFHYPYEDEHDELVLPPNERQSVLNTLIELKGRGAPLADSTACLKALRTNNWTCRPWMVASVDPDGKRTVGCYVKERGPIACEKCGFAAHAELSLAYAGVPGAILAGRKIFGF